MNAMCKIAWTTFIKVHCFLSLCEMTLSVPKTKHLIGKPVRHPSTNYIRNDNIKEIKTLVGLVDDKDWRQ